MVVQEYDVTSGRSLIASFVNGRTMDERIRMEKPDGVGGLDYYYYLTNALGSVAGLVDQSGAMVEYYLYDSYGAPAVFTQSGDINWQEGSENPNSTVGNPYMFTGRRWDSETSLYDYRARTYSPLMGRFLQRDPAGYIDSINLYAYVRNNPRNGTDPTGLFSLGDVWDSVQKTFRRIKFKIMNELARWSEGNSFQQAVFAVAKPIADIGFAYAEAILAGGFLLGPAGLTYMAYANYTINSFGSSQLEGLGLVGMYMAYVMIGNPIILAYGVFNQVYWTYGAHRFHPDEQTKQCINIGLDRYESTEDKIGINMQYPSGVRHWYGVRYTPPGKNAWSLDYNIYYDDRPDEMAFGIGLDGVDLIGHEIFHVLQRRAYSGTYFVVNSETQMEAQVNRFVRFWVDDELMNGAAYTRRGTLVCP